MNTGVYVHIPFCRKKCAYCSFYSMPTYALGKDEKNSLVERYINRLIEEISLRSPSFYDDIVDTIYFGGGTPSHIEAGYISKIVKSLRDSFNVNGEVEITLECNPRDFSSERMAEYTDCGINRVVLGVQTLNGELHSFIGRSGEVCSEEKLSEFCAVKNIVHCVDLMTAIPGQSEEDLYSDLETIGRHKFEHISAYMISIESGTPLAGKIADDRGHSDRQAGLFRHVIEYLKWHGYIHYEVSNFCLPSFESGHNLKYWEFAPYIGFGAAAHSFYGGERFYNPPSVEKYIKEKNPLIKDERSKNSALVEYIMTGMRLTGGISLNDMEKKIERKAPPVIMDAFARLEKDGYLIIEKRPDDIIVRLKKRGFFIMDTLIYEITNGII